eukprot:TRINITY_DN185_c0_g2_i1.p1 TRINITY_DN185_c0_g2~~TRINITY_DN185_c0_g2_i1.p1  ORF type:complete len:184 (-),score=48.39 TRINITY_DN185_c0_g2_i1:25-576(-)
MAVDICAMQEALRWEGCSPDAHLKELEKYGEVKTLEALAMLMDWSGDPKQLVTKVTGQRHTDDTPRPDHFNAFLAALEEREKRGISATEAEDLKLRLAADMDWPKFDHSRQEYIERTQLNSYDVLKCSQACFHLFEWLRLLLAESDRPPRFLSVDMQAYRVREKELKAAGCWPTEPPHGPAAR